MKTFLLGLGLAVPLACNASDRLLVQVPAVFDPGAPIAESVRAECAVDRAVGSHAFSALAARMPGTQAIADPQQAGSAKVLRLNLVSVMGVGGGRYSGRKTITVRAELVQDGKLLSTRTLTRGTGVFGMISGTCGLMEKIAMALGKDLSVWVPQAMSGMPVAPTEPAADDAADEPKT